MQSIRDDDFGCTMDVTSLYTNVPHTEGLEALAHYIDQKNELTPPTDFLVEMAKLIL